MQLRGCIPIVVTPFDEEHRVDEESLRTQVEYLVAGGVHGLATPGIAGEGYKLSDAERDRVAEVVIAAAAGRVPVVVSADGGGTLVAAERARRAARLGADALMVLPPSFVVPDAAGVMRYYLAVAEAAGVPIMVQDAPQLTGVALPAPLLVRLARECPLISSVKIEGTPAGPKTGEILQLGEGAIAVFAGWGGLSFWDGLLRGAAGCMPAPNFGPGLARVYDLFVAGERDAAYAQFTALAPFIAWSMQSLDLSVWTAKTVLQRLGVIKAAHLREPAALPDAILAGQLDQFLTP